jgi:hypothetical protein
MLDFLFKKNSTQSKELRDFLKSIKSHKTRKETSELQKKESNLFKEYLAKREKNLEDEARKDWDKLKRELKLNQNKNYDEIGRDQQKMIEFLDKNFNTIFIEEYRSVWMEIEKRKYEEKRGSDKETPRKIPKNSDGDDLYINETFDDEPPRNLIYSQKDLKLLKQAMKFDYFLIETYKNVVQQFFRASKNLGKGKIEEEEILALKIIVDNSSMQFQSCLSQYPADEKNKRDSLLKKFQDYFIEDSKKLDKNEEISYQISRFHDVLQGKSIPFSKIEEVKNIHTNDLSKLFQHIQKSQLNTDHKMEEIDKRKEYEVPQVHKHEN